MPIPQIIAYLAGTVYAVCQVLEAGGQIDGQLTVVKAICGILVATGIISASHSGPNTKA